jgi:broad specificity phosphatase PhoE
VETLVLVRHGATSWNENGYCQGRKDVRLSAAGREQIAFLRAELEAYEFEHAYSSPLTRARETARILGHEPEILPELAEIDRGHWEGHEAAEIKRRWGKLVRAWYDDPRGLAMPGGEGFDDLWERAGAVLDRMSSGPGETVLVCAHKAINRVIIARALGRPSKGVWDIPQPQACFSVLERRDGGWEAETIGSVEHLPSGLRSDK